MTYDFAGLGLDDFYKPLIPDPAPDVADQGDPYLLTVPDPSTTAYPYYLFHTDVSAEGNRIPVYGSSDLRRFVQERPLQAVLVTVAIGYILGKIVKRG